MKVLVILIMVSLVIALVFLAVFAWAIRSGQYDDTVTPSIRMLMEDKVKREPDASKKKSQHQTP